MKYIIFLLCTISVAFVNAQDVNVDVLFSKSATVDNSIELINDSIIPTRKVSENRIHQLISKKVAQNEQTPSTTGYRVQIASDNKRSNLVQIRYKYIGAHKEDRVYVVFNTPYYRLRIGNYIGPWGIWGAKFKANELKKEYTSVFFVKDRISLDELYAEE